MAFTKIAAAGIGSTETVTLHSLEVLNNATVGGVLTYEDVTNVDSIGIITARAGVLVGSGITLSKDGDIFATGVTTATTFVGALTGNVTGNISGGTVAGSTGTFTGNVAVSGGNITLQDSGGATDDRIVLGAGSDLSIYHDGTHTYLNNATGNLRIQNNGTIKSAQFEVDLVDFNDSANSTVHVRKEPAGNLNILKSALVGAALTVGTSSSTSTLIDKGFIELTRSSGDTYIDFKNAFADDFDSRILTNAANQLQFFTGGQGNTICALQTSTGKVGIATADSPSIAKLQIHSDKLGATAGNTQELLYMLSPDISNATSYRFTNYRHTNGTSHTSSEGRLRRHVDVTDQGYFGLGDNYASIGYGSNEIMRVRSNGLMTNGHQYYLLVDRSSNQTGYDANGSFGTPIVFNRIVTEQKDSSLSSGFDTSTGLFTAPVDGIYQLIAAAYNVSGVSFTQSWFTYNGGRMTYSDWVAATGVTIVQNSQIVYLAAGSTVGYHPHAGGGNSSITIQANTNHTWMKVTLLH